MKNLLISLLVAITFSGQAQITSTFDTDADGWTALNGSTGDPVYFNTAGNPGGFIQITDGAPGNATYFVASANFLGNKITSYGQFLRFDLQTSAGTKASSSTGDIQLLGTSTSLYLNLSTLPSTAPAWSSYSIKLDETQNWKVGSIGGAIATKAQVMSALASLTIIRINGEYITGPGDTGGIDNIILEQRILEAAPTITTFSPTSSQPGATITINGNNFDPAVANNAVYFGAIAGTITSANATQLTVTVPVGAQYGIITVINKITGLSKNSTTPFHPTFSGGGRIIPASFDPKIDITLSIDIDGLTITDVDGDGWSDLCVASSTMFKVIEIYRNLGLGGEITASSFAPKFTVAIPGTSTNNTGLKFVDLDGDGKLDATTSNVLVTFGKAYFITYRNISTPGNIAFEAPDYWQGNTDDSLPYLVEDIDGDGRPELIGGEGAGWIAQNISTLGNIEFGPSIYLPTSGLAGITLGDLDNDGKPEMLVSKGSSPSQSFYILKNNSTPGTISLTNLGEITTDNHAIQIADFNLDGKNDIVFRYWGGTQDIRILLNTNTGGALSLADFATQVVLDGDLGNYGGMSVADINGDGKLDIIATDNADVGVFENVYAGGVFDATAFIPAYEHQGNGNSTYPTSPIMADLNGDQKPEIIFGATNTSPKRISIYENKNIHAPVISLNTISPLKGPIGSTVTITGNNFSLIPSENNVWFGGVEATVLTATANLLTAEVPAGANYAPISVTKDGLTSRYRLPFQTTFGPGVTFDNTHFATPVNFTLTGANYDLDIADLNRDGKPDIIAEGTASNTYAFNNTYTTGLISSASLVPDDTLANFVNPRLEDFDGDGYFDIMSVTGPLRKNNSTSSEISFLPQVTVPLGTSIVDFADFNNDGKTDMTLTTDLSGTGDLILIENQTLNVSGNFVSGAYGFFSQNFVYNKPSPNGATITGDFDGDGFADIVTTNPTTDNISIYRNLGVLKISTAQFAARVDVAVGDNPNRIYKGDFDGDGKLDLMLYHSAGTSTTLLIVLQNTSTIGSISFSRIDLTNPSVATVAHIADLDGDGKPEILTTSEAGNRFSIFKNIHTSGALTTASFSAPFNTTVTAPRGITTSDVNLDGKPEIILTRAAGLLVVYENLISSGPSITINPQPTSTAVCDGVTTSFTLTATGTTNLTYQWQKFDGTVFNNVTNTGGYSGATTATLSINTTGNFGAGDYRCEVKGDLAPDKFSNTVSLTVNVVPVAPITTGASNCIAAAITLNASGGTNGQYRWYDVATNGTAISGQVNSAYVTPVINTTTTYFVSINNGLCESNRTAVIAEIKPLDKPLLTSSTQPVSGTINICEDDLLTITAPTGFTFYFWSNGATTNPITILTSVSSLTLQVTDAAGCVSAMSDALNIVVNPYPIATITPNGTQLTASTGDSYQWYQNSDVVAGATDQSFEYNLLEYGLYKVDVTDKGCKSTSEEFEYLITNSENSIDGLKMYPNPVEKTLFVEFHPPYSVYIFNSTGSLVGNVNSKTRTTSIDLSSLANGLYILQFKNEERTFYKRITKK